MGPRVLLEVRYWRHLLEQVARDMEATAGLEHDPKRERWLRARALRIRRRLLEGLPDRWREPRDVAERHRRR